MRKADDEKSFNLKEDYTFNAKKAACAWKDEQSLALLQCFQKGTIEDSSNRGHGGVGGGYFRGDWAFEDSACSHPGWSINQGGPTWPGTRSPPGRADWLPR